MPDISFSGPNQEINHLLDNVNKIAFGGATFNKVADGVRIVSDSLDIIKKVVDIYSQLKDKLKNTSVQGSSPALQLYLKSLNNDDPDDPVFHHLTEEEINKRSDFEK